MSIDASSPAPKHVPADQTAPARPRPLLRILGLSRFVVMLAVLASFVNATALLIYGAIRSYNLTTQFITSRPEPLSTKQLIYSCVEITDIFLLGTVLYVIALGLYELFIDASIQVPAWLIIKDIDDLKYKLISVVIAILGVTFLGQIVTWDGQRDLLAYGLAVGAVIAALTYFLSSKGDRHS